MILVTGGTGFIGQVLVRHLASSGHSVRLLLRPSPRTPRIPSGVPVEVAVSNLSDVRGLRAALHSVDTIYHLAGGEFEGGGANLQAVDIAGTRNLVTAAVDARIDRFFYLSHLGADRASGYPVMKAKGIAEEYIRKSSLHSTILRSGVVFGMGDHFTTNIALLAVATPFLLALPAKGQSLVQPLWVEDLAAALAWSLDDSSTVDRTLEVGGGEYFTVRQVFETILETIHRRRLLVPLNLPLLRAYTVTLESIFPRYPASVFWLDYFSANRTCTLDSLPRTFGLLPARFTNRLEHLRRVRWFPRMLRYFFTGA